jgi:hypothetical protein
MKVQKKDDKSKFFFQKKKECMFYNYNEYEYTKLRKKIK